MKDLKNLVKELKKEFKENLWAVVVKEFPTKEKEKPKNMTIAIINNLGTNKKFDFKKFKDVEFLTLSNLWQILFDGKYELVMDLVGLGKLKSEILYDYGIIDALRSVFILRDKVVKYFKRYVVSFILFGSWARGEAKKDSDIDVAVIIDDTDIKTMAREEARGRIWKIIGGMAAEIGKKFNVQVYLLTSFWDGIKEAHPVFFTLLRDGIPIYDKGLFNPWRILLKTGKIRPTPESINSFLKSGDLLRKSVKKDLTEMVIERLYYSLVNLGQAALMFIGVSPPVYSEVPKLLEEKFTKKGLLDKKYPRWISEIIQIRKNVEHGKTKELSGKDVDDWIERSKEFEDATKKLFDKLNAEVVEKKIKSTDELIQKTIDKIFEVLNVKETKDKLEKLKQLADIGKIPETFLEFVESFESAKKRKILYNEAIKIERDANTICNFVISFVENLKGRELVRKRMKVKYNKKIGEVWFFGNKVFIRRDNSKPEEIEVGELKNGEITNMKKSSIDEFKEEREKMGIGKPLEINEKTFKSIEKIFGKNAEVVFD